MIVNKITYSPGENVTFGFEIPLRGLSEITHFSDQITGETGTRFFDKFFRYTFDGIIYTDWQELTLPNLQNIVIPLKNDFILEFKYRRAGSSTTGQLVVDKINISGNYQLSYLQVLSFHDTPFDCISFTDDFFNRTWLNLLNKCYYKGMLPNFMVRGDVDENITKNDDDFILLWKSVCYFWAAVIALNNRKVTRFFEDRDNLLEYLRQRSLLFCGDEDYDYLSQIQSTIFAQIIKRGTEEIFKENGDHLSLVDEQEEVLRSICYEQECDEYLYDLVKNENVGWYIDRTSPEYTGTGINRYLDKDPIKTADFDSLTDFVVSSAAIVTDGDKEAVQIDAAGYIRTNRLKVDPEIAYEIAFFAKAENGALLDITCVSEDVSLTPISLEEFQDPNADSNTICQNVEFAVESEYYYIRAIIHGVGSTTVLNDSLDINVGNNLRFKNEDVCKFYFEIKNSGTGELYIWDLSFKPARTPNHCWLDSHAFINVWFNNRNEVDSIDKIIESWRRYLIPYNALLQPVDLTDELPPYNPDVNCDLLVLGLSWQPLLQDECAWLTNNGDQWFTAGGLYWELPTCVEGDGCIIVKRNNNTNLAPSSLSNDVIEISYDSGSNWSEVAAQGEDLVLCKCDYGNVLNVTEIICDLIFGRLVSDVRFNLNNNIKECGEVTLQNVKWYDGGGVEIVELDGEQDTSSISLTPYKLFNDYSGLIEKRSQYDTPDGTIFISTEWVYFGPIPEEKTPADCSFLISGSSEMYYSPRTVWLRRGVDGVVTTEDCGDVNGVLFSLFVEDCENYGTFIFNQLL